MRVLRIRSTRVEEIQIDERKFFDGTQTWDAIQLDEHHHMFVRDDALFDPTGITATVNGRNHVPLPACVFGTQGEKSVDCTLTVDQLRPLVRFGRRWTPASGELPMMGIDFRLDSRGDEYPWRALLSFPGERDAPTEYLMRLIAGRDYVSFEHPVHGDLRALDANFRDQARAIKDAIIARGYDTIVISSGHFESCLTIQFDDTIEFRDARLETVDVGHGTPFACDDAESELAAIAMACDVTEGSKVAAA